MDLLFQGLKGRHIITLGNAQGLENTPQSTESAKYFEALSTMASMIVLYRPYRALSIMLTSYTGRCPMLLNVSPSGLVIKENSELIARYLSQ